MTKKLFRMVVVAAVLVASGCSLLSADQIAALSKDGASMCITSDIRGGLGSLMAPAGGYGQSTLTICRSNRDNAKLTVGSDGSVTLENGESND